MSDLKTGQMLLVKSMETQPLEKGAQKGQFKAAAKGRMVMMYLATVDENTIADFSAEGSLLSIGFGPVTWTRATRRLVDALKASRAVIDPMAAGQEQVLKQIDEALAGVAAFDKATAKQP